MTGPLDLADVLAHTGWTCPAPRGGDTQAFAYDPDSLRHDRADDAPPTTTAQARDGWQPSGRLVRVDLKPCGCLAGDFCTCACDTTRDRIEVAHAPVIRLAPFNLARLRAEHTTAADQDRRERGAA